MRRVKAKVNPTIDDITKPTTIRPIDRPKTPIRMSIDMLGSVRVKIALLGRLVRDMEKIATAREGMTANRPMMMAKSGNMNLESSNAMAEPTKRIRAHVETVKRESAMQRLK